MSTIWAPQRDIVFPRIRKYRDIVASTRGRFGIGGYFRIEAFNAEDGRAHWLTPWFHNRVTNVGLDMMATTYVRYVACQVGTGNNAPTDADTTLQTYLSGTSSRVNLGDNINNTVSPYFYEIYIRYDFATGAATGNLSEIGVGQSASNGSNLFSRELIRDSGGNPTTITIASNESLRVHYKLRHYPPMTDATGNVTIDIAGTQTVFSYTRRALFMQNRWRPGNPDTGAGPLIGNGGGSFYSLYSGAIGGITGEPSGLLPSGSVGGGAAASYSPGSYSRTRTVTWGTGNANGTIRSVSFHGGGEGESGGFNFISRAGSWFQTEFNPTITKTSLDTFSLDFITSWGRPASYGCCF